jgi:hypothetical protein
MERGLGNEGVEHGGVGRYDLRSESLDMESNGGLNVGERLFIRLALSHDHALNTQRVGDVSVGVLLDHDLDLLRHRLQCGVGASASSPGQSSALSASLR